MGALLSKKGKRKKAGTTISDADRAVLDLKNARDKLRRYQAKLETESAALTAQARSLVAAQKRDRALLVIKFRRYREEKMAEVDGQLLRLEEMVQTIEWETRQTAVVASVRAGTDALEAIHATMSVESVERLMDETREALETERHIASLLTGDGALSAAQEADVEAEFDALAREADADEVDAEAGRQRRQREDDLAAHLPVAPTKTPDLVAPEARPATEQPAAVVAAAPQRVAVPA